MDFDEDRSQLCRGSAPQIMAGIRNLAIGLIHASGRTKIAPTLRWVGNQSRPLLICGVSVLASDF